MAVALAFDCSAEEVAFKKLKDSLETCWEDKSVEVGHTLDSGDQCGTYRGVQTNKDGLRPGM